MMAKASKEIKIREIGFFDIFRVMSMYKKRNEEQKEVFSPFILKSVWLFIYFCLFKKITAFIALDKRKIIGFGYTTNAKENDLGIMVLEDYQNCGIEARLLEELVKGREETYAQVNEEDKTAVKLYKKMGFKIVRKMLIMKL